jgi:UDP-N-acetylglucosamine acyltransferase
MNPTPYIHPNAKIGKDVIIEPFSYIYGDVEIGDGTWIGPSVTIMDGARIGKNCQVFPNAVISANPQDLKYKGEKTTTEVGDNSVIRECVTINKGTTDKMKTVVGKNSLIMAYVHIAHDCFIGNNCILANGVNLAGHIEIEDFAILEGLVAVQQFVKIGEHSFVCGGSMVRKNIPPYVRAAREPLSYAGINAIGMRRRGISDDDIRIVEDIYRHLYVMNNSISSGLIAIEKEVIECTQKTKVLNFIRNSDKGIVKGFSNLE